MLTCHAVLAYEDMEEDTYDFAHLRKFCKLFDFEVEQPTPICKEKKRDCSVDEYHLYRWDEYHYDHFVRVTITDNDPNSFFAQIALLQQ